MTALSILHDSRRGANHLKLGAHALDLCGLLSELSCESLYLFLLLRDRCLLLRDGCLQLLNFVVEHGLVLGLGAHARLRSASMRRRCGTRSAHGHVNAKLIGIKIKSNCNNVAPNWLGVVEDTTDEAGCRPEPVHRDVGDADRKVFVGDGGSVVVTNVLAHVSVIKACGQDWSCTSTYVFIRPTIKVC